MSSSLTETVVRSPCIGVCTLDAETGYCRGCLRTMDEIAAWPTAGQETRLAILDRVERRRLDGAVAVREPPWRQT